MRLSDSASGHRSSYVPRGKQGAKLVVKNAILIAAGGDCAPGIGVSDNYSRGSIEICGSTVDAVGGDGTAECGPGAGIGGGASETKNGGNAENIVVEDTVLAVEFSGIERESGVVGGGTSCCGSTGTAVYKLKNSTLKGKKEEIHEAQR